jgi:FtsH-binding integral membrane protein
MAVPTLITAVLLIVIGIVGYSGAEPSPEGKVSPTALIPAAVGLILGVCGLLALKDSWRKHAMHFAAIVGLIGMLGGFMPLMRQYSKTGTIDPLKPAAVSGELMALICGVFVILCVKSFIDARKARQAREAATTSATSGNG